MSRSASPASADSRPDTDEVSNFVHVTECECARQHLRATQLRIFRHKMWDTSVMAWATHNALRVVWYCQRCNQRYPETFEFSSSGKSRRFGAYQYHQGKKERLEVNIHWDDVRYEYLKIRGDAADYSLILFNCKAWATLFCKNISKRTRINTNECACDTLVHSHATAIEIYQNVNEEEIYEQIAVQYYVCTLHIRARIANEMQQLGKENTLCVVTSKNSAVWTTLTWAEFGLFTRGWMVADVTILFITIRSIGPGIFTGKLWHSETMLHVSAVSTSTRSR